MDQADANAKAFYLAHRSVSGASRLQHWRAARRDFIRYQKRRASLFCEGHQAQNFVAGFEPLDNSNVAASVVSQFYLASRFSRRFEMRDHRTDLRKIGHDACSTWIDTEPGIEDAACAVHDLNDLDAADACILFTETPRTPTRGGRMFEAGYAMAEGKSLIICGPMENVFCFLEEIAVCKDWPTVLHLLNPSLRHVWGPGISMEKVK